jgi:signal transduction histidine kinase
MRIADETQEVIEYSQQLKQKSEELGITAKQLRDANERLRQLDQQKDDFLSQVSHEVRTPLASIRSFSEILLDNEDLDPSQQRRFAGIIHGESERMTRLLDEILDLSLLERGEARWVLEPVDAETVLERAIAASTGLASQASVRLHTDERVGHAIVEADADRLSQVFINLLSNAIKHNDGEHPVVRIKSRIDAGRYEMVIEDNGPGISASDRERIFQKFSRGWSQKRADRTGAGLGLAISWQIMNRLGGKLELVSETGAGAKFRVSLPVRPTP